MANEINPFNKLAATPAPAPSKAKATTQTSGPAFPGLSNTGVDSINFSGSIFATGEASPVKAPAINLREPGSIERLLQDPQYMAVANRISGAFGSNASKVKSEFSPKSKLGESKLFSELALNRAYNLALADEDSAQ
jgi:hypothetical protein